MKVGFFLTKRNGVLIFILTVGVFGILNTEMGVFGLLPAIADHFHVSIAKAGLLVSLFALTVAISGPTLPLVLSGINRKKLMLLVLGMFFLGNIVSIFTTDFSILLIVRIVLGFFHPIYISLAITVAASSVRKEDVPKTVSKIFIGVSAGMVAGIPIASFINNVLSYEMAMVFFAVVTIIVLIATVFLIPSMPVKERLSYGTQLSVLKKPTIWLSIITVILLNSAIFGVYSYFAEYTKTVTHMSPNIISLTLFIFGGASIIGNIVTGKMLAHSAVKTVVLFPLLAGVVYVILFFTGQFAIPMAIITLFWGTLAGGLIANINQYLISTSAPEAPDFANGIFVSSSNIGTTVGSFIGGIFISQLGTHYVILVGILSVILGLIVIFIRNATVVPQQQLKRSSS